VAFDFHYDQHITIVPIAGVMAVDRSSNEVAKWREGNARVMGFSSAR